MSHSISHIIFHLNLAYSSIELDSHIDVINRCYWPLLKMAKEHAIPIGVEATGYTLERIAALDPAWIETLKSHIRNGLCEFIGSGLAQIIGPLVPSEVVEANLYLGNQAYEQLLDVRPTIALVNEQVFSAGIIPAYHAAGYKAIVMEWENPAAANPQWPARVWSLPCEAVARNGRPMPLLWNSSMSNQKLQRLAHGDLTVDEYSSYVRTLSLQDGCALLLYGGDAEVFNYRPGRYKSESPLHICDEWNIIFTVFKQLHDESIFSFVLPSQVLDKHSSRQALKLETAAQPLPVKKQHKYNPTRWAITGSDDLGINTACWRIFRSLQHSVRTDPAAWRELCLFWASDYRTHITPVRWQDIRAQVQTRLQALVPPHIQTCTSGDASEVTVNRENRFLILKAGSVTLRLNIRKGLAIDAAWFGEVCKDALFGSLAHGHFEDLSLAADFFSGHLVLERAGCAKETDLEIVEPEVEITAEAVNASCIITQFPVPLRKTVSISRLQPEVSIIYTCDWNMLNQCSLRLGFLTLLPAAFDADTLTYATHNGGRDLEHFLLEGKEFNHGQPVSSLVSANQCLGMTQGILWIGDATKMLEIEINHAGAAAAPMVLHRKARPDYLFRCFFSLRETDETSTGCMPPIFEKMDEFRISVRAKRCQPTKNQ